MMKFVVCFILSFFMLSAAYGQRSFTISGYVKDAGDGESLIGAFIYDKDNYRYAVTTNNYGFYSLSVPEAMYKLIFSYTGYQSEEVVIYIGKDTLLNVELESGILLENVVIDSKRQDARNNVLSAQVGVVKLDVENIKAMPALMGEVDILKSIQLLPGVVSSSDGNSGFFVRGGGSDQNLVLLDEATVYNTGHMLGFFSVFNADAIRNSTLIKGGVPANYGHRLSSVLDIRMKEGNDKMFKLEGGIGLISSRLTIEGPLVENRSSFIVSARRTYVLDLVQPFLKGNRFEGTNYYFYDLNAKFNYRISDRDRLYFSSYYGRDIFTLNFANRDFSLNLPYGNSIAALRWNRVFSSKLFMNSSLIYSDYDYNLTAGQENIRFNNFSGIRDWNFKTDFDYYLNYSHTFKFGYHYTYHRLTPNVFSIEAQEFEIKNEGLPTFSHENSIYLSDEWNVSRQLLINTGVRATAYSQMGNYVSKTDDRTYSSGELVKTYYIADPRLSFRYRMLDNSSIKGSVSISSQFLHQVSNASGSFPSDTWVSSSQYVKPGKGIQYSIGFFKNLLSDEFETSAELYYKDLWNQIEFREDFTGGIESDIEKKFVFGKGRAYGLELFLRKNSGRLSGWISYTLSRTERKFELIDDNNWFRNTYDRPHDISIVANYALNDKWSFNTVFVYNSGRRYTPVTDVYVLDGRVNLEFGRRNSAAYDPYHRLDISFTYVPSDNKKWRSSWSFGVYNVYNRKNPAFVSYDTDIDLENGSSSITASKITIFPAIPSISYNFRWNSK